MATIGLVVNPAAGRDIRRLTGGASVVDDYSKRRIAECVAAGVGVAADECTLAVMPDSAGIGAHAVSEAPAAVTADLLEISVEGGPADTRRAAARFRDEADVVVVLGGDGTNRDVAHEVGDVPLVSVSTGTNNVVPTAVDGTVAGAAAALIATEAVDPDAVSIDHGMVEAVADTPTGESRLQGLATLGVLDVEFVGTRAILDPSTVVGGVVSRAFSAEIGLSSVAGALTTHRPGTPGGVGFRLGPPETAAETVQAIVAPGVVERVGVEEWRPLAADESTRFEVDRGVLSVDGERELELQNAVVDVAPIDDGPRIVDVDAVFVAAEGALRTDRLE
ncbi:NAD(+)/NADH kinase [Natribaculum luteum]|uniref:NAD(+)/NADH kinase n=1 Tax=Natribaculum luteum TaxID=1586232 RepID=A0ABD5P4M9_9EURY|nr:NAD(+)/NADH kinase [Natribaculum luteum]